MIKILFVSRNLIFFDLIREFHKGKVDISFESLDEYTDVANKEYEVIILDFNNIKHIKQEALDILVSNNKNSKFFIMKGPDDEDADISFLREVNFTYIDKSKYPIDLHRLLFETFKDIFPMHSFIENGHLLESFKRLSLREKEILLMITEGMSSEEIAKQLFISEQTVDTHRKHIKTKLGVDHKKKLMNFILEHRDAFKQLRIGFEDDIRHS